MSDVMDEVRNEEATPGDPPRPRATFRGNGYDLTALGALATGVLVLLACATCGQLFTCLPIVPIILGFIGLIMARDAVDEERTRLWSWLGIGGGGLTLLLVTLLIAGYFAFVFFLILVSQTGN